jgi:hypothetical protein
MFQFLPLPLRLRGFARVRKRVAHTLFFSRERERGRKEPLRGGVLLVFGQSLACVTVIWLLSGPPRLYANMGPPSVFRTGSQIGELPGASSVSIVQEKLHIDLRPLAEAQPVPISVRYVLDNPRALQELDLLFVGGTMTDGPATAADNPRDLDGITTVVGDSAAIGLF